LETKLARIAQIAKERPKEQFTSLAHLLNVEMLRKCHRELSGNKASGIDEVTKAQYEENLSENLEKLHKSLRTMTFKPQAKACIHS
jgi:RNA-directed DNA polymerase